MNNFGGHVDHYDKARAKHVAKDNSRQERCKQWSSDVSRGSECHRNAMNILTDP